MERLITIFSYTIVICISFLIGNLFNNSTCAALPTEFNITSGSYVVNWFKTELDLQTELGEPDTGGMAECEWRPEFNHSFCEFWLVEPTELDTWTDDFEQDVWKTIGHEFYHATKGDFHE